LLISATSQLSALSKYLNRSLPKHPIALGRTLISLSDVMVENQKFPLPPEIDEILDRLPPQVTLNVPSDVLVHWFSPASADGDMDEVTLARAENYARSCGCRFAYHASIREGVFYRLVKPPQ
jgi:hypothetical protein